MSNVPPVNFRQTFRILTWNCDGPVTRKWEVAQFLQSQDIHITVSSEIHRTSRSVAKIQDYQLHL